MSVMNVAFTSHYLHVNTNVTVILPDIESDAPKQYYSSNRDFRVLWLLPDLECDHTKWLRYTNVERYACKKKTVVVMPSAENSDFIDWDSYSTGFEACHFFFEELMPLIRAWLPVSEKRRDNMIAGVTDAPVRLALLHPECFSAAVKLRGELTDYRALVDAHPFVRILEEEGKEKERRLWREQAEPGSLRLLNIIENAGGVENFLRSDCNVLYIMEKYAQDFNSACPELYFLTENADKAYQMFQERLEALDLPIHFLRLPKTEDRWEALESALRKILE